MSLLGPDGKPLSAGNIVDISEQNAEEKELKETEFKLFVAQWDVFIKAKTEDDAISCIRGQELLKMHMKEDAIRRLWNIAQEAGEMVSEFPERDVFMLQTMEFSLAIMSGNPRVLNNPQFVATVACTKVGLFETPSPKENTNE